MNRDSISAFGGIAAFVPQMDADLFCSTCARVAGRFAARVRAFAFAAAMGVTIPASAEMPASPYEPLAAVNGMDLVLKDDPAKNEDIREIMGQYGLTEEFAQIPRMTVVQRRKLAEYYGACKKIGMKNRLLAGGLASIVRGYSGIERASEFVAEYKKTGKILRDLPMPYANFSTAVERYKDPDGKPNAAEAIFAPELEATKKMEDQLKVILEKSAADADKRAADADKRAADADKRAADADKRAAEYRKEAAETQKRIELLDSILKHLK